MPSTATVSQVSTEGSPVVSHHVTHVLLDVPFGENVTSLLFPVAGKSDARTTDSPNSFVERMQPIAPSSMS